MRQDLQDIKALLRGKTSVPSSVAVSENASPPAAADMPKEAQGDDAGVIHVDSGWANQRFTPGFHQAATQPAKAKYG